MSKITQQSEQIMFTRPIFQLIYNRISEIRRFIQVLAGPRQVGKTTLAKQLMVKVSFPVIYASGDDPDWRGHDWIEQQWELARLKTKSYGEALLILDEVCKTPSWSEIVKKLWDEDTFNNVPLKVILLGSAPLLMQHGLTESLAGRFEIIPIMHWIFAEMQAAFGWTLEQYIFFGGYPGSASLIDDQSRWSNYVRDSLITTTISKDILLLTSIKKPALLRMLFQLGCEYSGQILSYQKMLGQLHDAGNTTTLAHYLRMLSDIGMLTGLEKITRGKITQRSSSPKLQVFNNALITAQANFTLHDAETNRDYWGRLVESAIGAHLLNSISGKKIELFYWREKNSEVDFILRQNHKIVALEIKSGRKVTTLSGIHAFKKIFPNAKSLLVGGQGMKIEEFLNMQIEDLF